ncbi:MAG: DinB family protein [Flammeovirgaceae bacterium]
MKQFELLEQLQQEVLNISEQVSLHFAEESNALLNWKEKPTSWSVLECLTHLNFYSAYYQHEIQQKLSIKSAHPETSRVYKAGLIGGYFVNMVLPSNAKKMKTLARMNPAESQLDANQVIPKFLAYQKALIQQLEAAKALDLNKTKVPLEFFKLIYLRLGDVFRFLVAHSQRHILQAERALEAAKSYEHPSVKNLS